VSGANLKGRQNLFCVPEPWASAAQARAKKHKGGFWSSPSMKENKLIKEIFHVKEYLLAGKSLLQRKKIL
jgi:hypothetical protein